MENKSTDGPSGEPQATEKHTLGPTPGPWRYDEEHHSVVDGSNTMIAVSGISQPHGYVPYDDVSYANARLIAVAPDHALYARAITQGVIRWEWLPSRTSGEVCVGGIRWATDLDEFGVPVLHDSLRAAIAKATEGGGQ